jgi:hypothetical protein
LVFLIILIIATAGLLAWALVAVTRVTLGDLRLPRLQASPPEPAAIDAHIESSPSVEAGPSAGRETQIRDGSDAELAVREHLYGRRSRRP